jgi:lysophospholipase L1-like esterase
MAARAGCVMDGSPGKRMQRRTFLGRLLAGAATLAAPSIEAAGKDVRREARPSLPRGGQVLFQGDSITDGGRWRDSDDPNHVFGQSYPYLLAARCGGHFPQQQWRFVNRGISGDTVKALMARWDRDTLALKPDVLSVLVGANDTLSQFDKGIPLPTSVAEYASVYDAILRRTRGALPRVKLVLCEPFALPGTRNSGRWQAWRKDMAERQAIVRRLALAHRAVFVPLQAMFDDACKRAPADYWIWDGVHPTSAGHQLIADQWLRMTGRSA